MPEAWWVFIEPTAFGWIATAESNRGRRLTYSDELGTHAREVWRPTGQWARRAMARRVQRFTRRQQRHLAREERTLSYPV